MMEKCEESRLRDKTVLFRARLLERERNWLLEEKLIFATATRAKGNKIVPPIETTNLSKTL